MEELWRSPNEWVLIELDDGQMVLCVNCGTSVGHQTNHVLSREEREEHMIAGWVYLDLLAAKVVNTPWAYESNVASVPMIDFTSRGAENVFIPPGR